LLSRSGSYNTSEHAEADGATALEWERASDLGRGPISTFSDEAEHGVPADVFRSQLSDSAVDGDWGDGESKTVLFITSRFPPVASVGATRIRKFAKYLGQFGWRPIVITGAGPTTRSSDHSVRGAVDEETVLDLPRGLPVYRLSAALDDLPTFLSRGYAARLYPATQWLGMDRRAWEDALLWRFRRVHDWGSFPDSGVWRLASTVALALRLHRHYRFRAIFSSGMPFSDHMIGMVIRRLLRRPWLADFRDPWVEYIHDTQWNSPSRRRLTRMAEAAIVREASSVISVNDHMTRRFASRYPGRSRGKFVTITNGFDPADFATGAERVPNQCFRLLYAGSLYKTRNPASVLAAFRRFIKDTPGSQQHARFDFLGRPGPFIKMLEAASDEGRVRYAGMLPHREALRAVAEADLNVVLHPKIPGSACDTATKIYECLGSGRPILAVVPLDGAAAAELRGFDGVTLCDPDDSVGISRGIAEWYRRWLAGEDRVSRSDEALAPLTRRHQAGLLARCLDAAVGAKRYSEQGTR
jgi:hypothetical protein